MFLFIYTPGKNLPEKICYNEAFMSKLSHDVDLENLVLDEDPYPKIFTIGIETSEDWGKNFSERADMTSGRSLGIIGQSSLLGYTKNCQIKRVFLNLRVVVNTGVTDVAAPVSLGQRLHAPVNFQA